MYQDTQHPAPQAPQTVLPEFCRVSYIANPRSWGFAARTQLDSGSRRLCMYCSHMQDIIWTDLMLLPSMSHRSDRSVVGRAVDAVHIRTLWVAIAVEDHVLCTNQKPIFTRRVVHRVCSFVERSYCLSRQMQDSHDSMARKLGMSLPLSFLLLIHDLRTCYAGAHQPGGQRQRATCLWRYRPRCRCPSFHISRDHGDCLHGAVHR